MNSKNIKKDDKQIAMELLAVVEQFSDHVIITDKEGLIEYVNPAFERDTGYSKQEVIGKTPDILSPENHDEKYHGTLWDSLKEGKEVKSLTINKKKNGDLYYSDRLISPIKNEDNEITHFVSIWKDDSERRAWEEELETQKWGLAKTNKALRSLYKKLEERNDELKQLDQLKSDFVATVSHEIRTPLAISMEGINLIIDGLTGEINEKQEKLLNVSKKNLKRLNRIIDDLLDISKIESGKMDLLQNFTDITQLIRETVDSFQSVVAVNDLNLTVNLPSESIYLQVDEDKIVQVITNLLSNANKFTPKDGKITVSLVKREADVMCSIADTGRGISKEDVGNLFKKFQQFGRESGAGIKGTGLGLAISKSLIELHKGKIWAESVLNEGTTFFFTLPIYETVKSEFDHYFSDVLTEAQSTQKSASFIITFLNNFDEIKNKYGDEVLIKFMSTAFEAINRVNSRVGDKSVLYDVHTIHTLLSDTDEAGGVSVISRMKKAIEACQFTLVEKSSTKSKDKKELIKADFKFGLAVFPVDAQDRKGLIAEALNSIIKEKYSSR